MTHHYIGNGGGDPPPGGSLLKVFEPVYELVFTNQETKKQIRVLVPRKGIFYDPERETTQADLRKLSHAITEVLKSELDTPEPGETGHKDLDTSELVQPDVDAPQAGGS